MSTVYLVVERGYWENNLQYEVIEDRRFWNHAENRPEEEKTSCGIFPTKGAAEAEAARLRRENSNT